MLSGWQEEEAEDAREELREYAREIEVIAYALHYADCAIDEDDYLEGKASGMEAMLAVTACVPVHYVAYMVSEYRKRHGI